MGDEAELAAMLALIEQYDLAKDYENRYIAVIGAMSTAILCGYATGIRIDPDDPEWPVVLIQLPVAKEVSDRVAQDKLVVSRMDADLLDQKWYDNGYGYFKRQEHLPLPRGYIHRIIAERMFGAIPEGYEVDHVNRETWDCGRDNLRLATSRAQKLFQLRISVKQRKNGRWQALFGTRPQISLGMADTRSEAEATCRAHRARLISECFANGEIITWPGSSNQVSWHMPQHPIPWDGHDNDEKYRRCAAYRAAHPRS